MFLFCLLALISNGQRGESTLEKQVEKAEIIIEGTVLERQEFIAENGKSYFEYTIDVYKKIKGNYNDSQITVISRGSSQYSSPHIHMLDSADYGIFFLRVATNKKPNNESVLYSRISKFIQFFHTTEGLEGRTSVNVYKDIDNELYKPLKALVGQEIIQIKPLPDDLLEGNSEIMKN